jgi:hypothetical protein
MTMSYVVRFVSRLLFSYPTRIWADASLLQRSRVVNALVIKDEEDANDHKVVINIYDSDDEKEGVLDDEDTDGEMDESVHKVELTGELKALGIDPKQRRACCHSFIVMLEHLK